MACFNTNTNNCFGPYYPCPVFCCRCECSSNSVVNPPIEDSFAFLSLDTTTTVSSGGIVPLTLSSSGGSSITSTTVGEVVLAVGTYQATYNINSVIGASGTNSFGLTLNGTTIASSISNTTSTVGSAISNTNSVVFTVATPSVLRLINLGTDTVVVSNANLFIRKIN